MNVILVAIAAFLVGASKAGLRGLGMVTVALMAIVYGAKASTGILLPMLIVGDVLAVIYFKRHTRWIYLQKFLPAMIAGVLIAVWVGKDLPEEAFKNFMGVIILVSVILMFWWDLKARILTPNNWIFAGSAGVAAGFTTMIGNLAGAFATMFFLATRMPKNEIIGTSAWLFFIINLFKVPFHIWVWHTIDWSSLKTDLFFLPAILIGFYVGLKLVVLFSEKYYRYFLLAVTAIGALVILLK